MNDLLSDSFQLPKRGDGQSGPNGGDIEIGNVDSSKDQGMTQFFEEVGAIKNLMVEVRKSLQKLQNEHEESKSVTRAPAMKEIKQHMEVEVDKVTKVAKNVKDKLEALEKANVKSRSKPGCGEGTSLDRTRMSMTAALKKKLKDMMFEFQTLRQKIQEEYRDVVGRRVFTVTGKKVDEETIEQLIESGDSEQIFQKAIQEQGRGQILDTVAEIQERHDAVKDIERKLLHLNQVFLDMAVLVEAQGEMLDNIENQVASAVEHVQAGTTSLRRAKSLQRNSRKWMCIAIVILLITIAIILVAVFQPWKPKSST